MKGGQQSGVTAVPVGGDRVVVVMVVVTTTHRM
jgi:hypothetical protein